jgi:hypothetical protein
MNILPFHDANIVLFGKNLVYVVLNVRIVLDEPVSDGLDNRALDLNGTAHVLLVRES